MWTYCKQDIWSYMLPYRRDANWRWDEFVSYTLGRTDRIQFNQNRYNFKVSRISIAVIKITLYFSIRYPILYNYVKIVSLHYYPSVIPVAFFRGIGSLFCLKKIRVSIYSLCQKNIFSEISTHFSMVQIFSN